jgi:hypothetical protein
MPDFKADKRVRLDFVVFVFVSALTGKAAVSSQRELLEVPFNYIVGTQTFSPAYQFTSKSKLMETAEAILDMGSNIVKTRVRERDKDLEALLDMPFSYYFFWYRSQSRTWKRGLSDQDKQIEYDSVYAFTKTLLTRSSGTNKTFFLGHWEGDWYLLSNYDPQSEVPERAIQGMIDWLNIRQQAVDDARRDTPHHGVQVYAYVEVNRVRDAMLHGQKRLVNRVLPHTNIDYVSYSAYDMQRLTPAEVHKTLDYVESKLSEKASLAGKRVFIGEFGIPAQAVAYDSDEHERKNREIMLKFLTWGCPFVLYWEMYNNEVKDGKQKGFWLINDKNEKQPLYFTHQNLYRGAARYIAAFQQTHDRRPSTTEYRAWATDWLSRQAD